MLNIRPILLVIGTLLVVLSIAMIIPAMVDFLTESGEWQAFIISAFYTAFSGVALILTNQGGGENRNLSLKQAFILTTFSWLILAIFAALPFVFSIHLSYTNSFFEAISGLTATGTTIIIGLDDLPMGILLWRSILQWLGGIGIIVMAMAVLPILKIGGMQLFRTESSDKSDKIFPRVGQLCGAISSVYMFLTILCCFFLWIAGMDFFDAICHAMTTISTGGLSTHDASIVFFDNQMIESILIIFMIISGIPFILYIQFARGKPLALWSDTQVRWFLSMIIVCIAIVTVWLVYRMDLTLAEAFRRAAFNVVSVITTTGFSSSDYTTWGSFIVTFIFLISVVGGCTGSTTGGIKIFRYQVLFETAKTQINQLIQPHGVFKPLFNKKPISPAASSSVLSFFILFAFFFTMLAILLSLTGLDYITSMSASASAMANLGPGLGDIIGPSGNYSTLSDTAKWILALGMLVGRLEIFTVLILFTPYFWRN